MHIVVGNIWDELRRASAIFVSTNAEINSRDELVMGRGLAAQAKMMFPTLASELAVQRWARSHAEAMNCMYGLLPGIRVPRPYGSEGTVQIGAFQVKYRWSEPADTKLISYSVAKLCEAAENYGRIALNFPGIGNGKLTEEEVLPHLERLPANVYVYKLPKRGRN